MKPLVFLDMDGVINDLGANCASAPPITPSPRTYNVTTVRSHGLTVCIPQYMPKLIQALVSSNEVHWLTLWREHVNDEIAEHLGIPRLPVITDGEWYTPISWKAEHAAPIADAALASGREVWWIEDFYGNLPSATMPPSTRFIDTAADTDRPVLLPSMLPSRLLGPGWQGPTRP